MNNIEKRPFDWGPLWKGHFFLFEKSSLPDYPANAGMKLLLIVLFLESVRSLINASTDRIDINISSWFLLIQVLSLLLLLLILIRVFAKVRFDQLGLQAWSYWTLTEKYYFIQVIPLAIVVFSYIYSSELKVFLAQPNRLEIGIFVIAIRMTWGFYQEFLYRGLLQSELVRRWGSFLGILTSNLIFTFGPLHFYHFKAAEGNLSHLWVFAAIFGIGLVFSLIFKRSGNLWIISIMHGIGNTFIDGFANLGL